jgi:hypothetical protein
MKAIILIASALNLAAQVIGPITPSRPPSEVRTPTGKASIEGTVVDLLTSQPIRKAAVMLQGRISLNAVTDTSGHFAFRLLPSGQYSVRASNENYPEQRPARSQLALSLGEDEQKQDVKLELVPGGMVSGHVADEEDNPMQSCSVSAMQSRETEAGPMPRMMGSGQSDDKGEYRITKLPRGKYYVMARCIQSVPLPHAFLLRSAQSDLPRLVYPVRFYPGGLDLTAAARMNVSPGANVSGIDFKLSPANGFTIRGHAAGLPGGGTSQMWLESRDASTRQWQPPYQRPRARLDQQTGEFEIRNVLPGSYDLVAFGSIENRLYFARVLVEVGAKKLEPIDIALTEAPSVTGTISVDGDAQAPMTGFKLSLSPLEQYAMIARPPQTDVQSDGAFSFNSVMPGHWRLDVYGGPAYLKSVTRGDQEVSPKDLEVGASPVALKIVLGVKFGQIDATISEPVSSSERVAIVLWLAGDTSVAQSFSFNGQTQPIPNLRPGKYYACAVAGGQPGLLLQYAMRKELESRCATVEVAEGQHATLQVPLISSTELERLIETLEE